MKNRNWLWILILSVVLTLSLVIACDEEEDEEDDSDDGGGGCSVKYVCQYMMDNNCSDFTSISECESIWTESCTNVSAYLPCACDCLASATGCETIQTGCEHDCWNTYCL